MDRQWDLLVIGAGPAGLSAACAAQECGLDVILVDEQAAPGGQLFRNIEYPMAQRLFDDKELVGGLNLVKRFQELEIHYVPKATLWGLEKGRARCTVNGKPVCLKASNILLASGAMERPVPFPGWTLPGVMGAGGADIVLRSGGLPVENAQGSVVLAGNGPLLFLLAGHLLDAGVNISAWLDTGNWSHRLLSGALMPGAFADFPYLMKGMKMALRAFKHIRVIPGVNSIRVLGEKRIEAVSFLARGQKEELPAAAFLRHEGVIPRTHILASLQARHHWDRVQRYWYPDVTECGGTSLPGIFQAGDGAYVHGGDASMLKGTLAGVEIARKMGIISNGEAAWRTRKERLRLRAMRVGRAYLRHVFAPNPNIFSVPDDTIICRCECVTAGDIRQAVRVGYNEVNEVKRFTRCGMGQCQGRMCGGALAEIVAAESGKSVPQVGRLNIRQPFRPVALEDYCAIN